MDSPSFESVTFLSRMGLSSPAANAARSALTSWLNATRLMNTSLFSCSATLSKRAWMWIDLRVGTTRTGPADGVWSGSQSSLSSSSSTRFVVLLLVVRPRRGVIGRRVHGLSHEPEPLLEPGSRSGQWSNGRPAGSGPSSRSSGAGGSCPGYGRRPAARRTWP